MGIKVANNAFATLASSITSSGTSITLTTGQGARFPSLGAGDYFYATLVDTSNNLEIVKCTARSTDVLTVVRAQESTTARAYSAGDRIEIRLTAATFTDATQSLPTQTGNAGKYLKTDGTSASWETVSVTPTAISDQTNSSTGYFDLPAGTTAQRPGTPGSGMIRFNTTIGEPEWYDTNSSSWLRFSQGGQYTLEYLVIAGGAGGSLGNNPGGGGGAGGVVSANQTVLSGAIVSVTVGSGGAGAINSGTQGGSGGNSSISGGVTTVTATGGGGGGSGSGTGVSGGSGGGGTYNTGGGSGTAGQGFAGGGGSVSGGTYSGGGGGGAGGAGANSSGGAVVDGGSSTSAYSTWASATSTGVSGNYAGGGGAGGYAASRTSVGGGGGAGNGVNATSGTPTGGNATANTGSGGGGIGGGGANGTGGAGGSGIVILRYSGAQRATGGTVTSSGGYTYHTFTSSGTFTA
jgi:hypothetical protein